MRPSAFNCAPVARRGLLVALGLSELIGICEQDGLGGVIAVAAFGPPAVIAGLDDLTVNGSISRAAQSSHLSFAEHAPARPGIPSSA